MINISMTAKFIPEGIYGLQVSRYANNGRIAFSLHDAETGEPWAKLSTNIDERMFPVDLDNEVLIKSYAENAGILESLEEHGVVEHFADIPLGWDNLVHVCRIKDQEVLDAVKELPKFGLG